MVVGIALRAGSLERLQGTTDLKSTRVVSGGPMSVHELENAISQLSYEEFSQLVRWIDEYRSELWDRRIEADIAAGRLDKAGDQANKEFDLGRCTEL
jgi:hypothetical protein